jgi:hypothetical protein
MRPGQRFSATTWFFLALLTATTASAQNPFAGTWHINQEKSQLAGETLKFGPAEGNAIQLTAGGVSYSFRLDGANYATPSGDIAVWRQITPDSWTTEYRKTDGKLLSRDSWKLSTDGKTLTDTTSGVKADGDLYTDTAEYARTDGTSGLMGSWKSTAVKLSSPNELSIQEIGLDKLLLKIPALKASCELNFNGQETPVDGPDLPTGLRLSLKRTGPYSFNLTQKLNGSTVSSSVYTVSDDGKTMTEVGGTPGDSPSTVVWEKQ